MYNIGNFKPWWFRDYERQIGAESEIIISGFGVIFSKNKYFYLFVKVATM